jgi:hypothetical protein
MKKPDGFEITWAEDGLSAYLRPTEEAPSVRLRVEQWFPDQQLDAQPAWIALAGVAPSSNSPAAIVETYLGFLDRTRMIKRLTLCPAMNLRLPVISLMRNHFQRRISSDWRFRWEFVPTET